MRAVMDFTRALALVALFCAHASAQPAPAVDPAVIGTWERTFSTPFGQGKSIWVIRPDGSYLMRPEGAATAQHSGKVTFGAGLWTMQATTGGGPFGPPRDQGSYRLDGPDTIEAIGVLGNQSWQRAGTVRTARTEQAPPPPPPPRPVPVELRQVGSQRVPANVAALLPYVDYRAKGWRADAILVELLLRARESQPDILDIAFVYYSPSEMTEAAIAPDLPPDRPVADTPRTRFPTGRLPPRVADPITALNAARGNGLATLAEGRLTVAFLDSESRVLIWDLAQTTEPDARHLYVDGWTGAVLEGTPRDDPRTRKPGWNANAANFERFAIGQLRNPGPRPMGWLPPFGTSCSTGASCRAIQARDFDAARRIDGGYPTAADLERFDR